MRVLRAVSVFGALAFILCLGVACDDNDDGSRVLTLPLGGQITESAYRDHVRQLINPTLPGSIELCDFYDGLDGRRKVEAAGSPENLPALDQTPTADEIDRASAIITDACENVREELGVN
jgi:hypothetical protein